MNIKVDLNTNITDGSEVVFRSPADCSKVTGLVIYHHGGKTEFAFADAHGNNVGDIDHLFAENAVVKVILDVTARMAFVQNADTNAYIERTFVKSVNGQAPDKNGNVEIAVPGGGNENSYTPTGAVGDGIIDDTAAIQAALDACYASGGGVVHIPRGTYLLSDSLKLHSNQRIVGDPGAVLLQKDGNTGGAYGNLMRSYYNGSGGYEATENVIIEGITFDGGDQVNTPSTLLSFCHARNIQIRNCTFRNGFSNDDVGNGHDIEINSSENVTIDHCTFVNNRRTGYLSELIQIDAAWAISAYPWEPDEGERNDDGTLSDNIRISHCYFEGNVTDKAYERNTFIGGHADVTTTGVVVENCTLKTGGYCVRFKKVSGLTVRSNEIHDSLVGVYMTDEYENVVVLNNVGRGEVQRIYPSEKATGSGNILNGKPVEMQEGGGIEVSGAKVGQLLKVAAVDEKGVPTAWETTDISNKWKLIADFATTEEVSSFFITKRLDGSPLNIDGNKEILCYCVAAPSATNTAKVPTQFTVDSTVYSYVKDSVYTDTYYTCRWLKIGNCNGKIVYSSNGSFGYSKSPTANFVQMSHHYDLYTRTSRAYPIESIGYNTNNEGVFGVGSRILIYERG